MAFAHLVNKQKRV